MEWSFDLLADGRADRLAATLDLSRQFRSRGRGGDLRRRSPWFASDVRPRGRLGGQVDPEAGGARSASRFRMLETISEYGRERLRDAGEEDRAPVSDTEIGTWSLRPACSSTAGVPPKSSGGSGRTSSSPTSGRPFAGVWRIRMGERGLAMAANLAYYWLTTGASARVDAGWTPSSRFPAANAWSCDGSRDRWMAGPVAGRHSRRLRPLRRERADRVRSGRRVQRRASPRSRWAERLMFVGSRPGRGPAGALPRRPARPAGSALGSERARPLGSVWSLRGDHARAFDLFGRQSTCAGAAATGTSRRGCFRARPWRPGTLGTWRPPVGSCLRRSGSATTWRTG